MSLDDQFVVYNPVPTDDGFVLWNALEGGWQFRLGDGWSRLPPLIPRSGTVIGDATAVSVDGRLIAVAHVGAADQDSIEITELGDKGWAPLRYVSSGWIGFPQATVVNGQIVVLGINSDPSNSPLLIDPDASTLVPLRGYPIETTFEQGAAWSGRWLLVWGGQTQTSVAGSSTSNAGPISDQGATWQP